MDRKQGEFGYNNWGCRRTTMYLSLIPYNSKPGAFRERKVKSASGSQAAGKTSGRSSRTTVIVNFSNSALLTLRNTVLMPTLARAATMQPGMISPRNPRSVFPQLGTQCAYGWANGRLSI